MTAPFDPELLVADLTDEQLDQLRNEIMREQYRRGELRRRGRS